MTANILEATGITKRFDGFAALTSVDFGLLKGERVRARARTNRAFGGRSAGAPEKKNELVRKYYLGVGAGNEKRPQP